jgi:hypothetical protein
MVLQLWRAIRDLWPKKKARGEMRCGTPYIQKHSKDPNFRIGLGYKQSEGSSLIEYIYPYDGHREIRWVPKDDKK